MFLGVLAYAGLLTYGLPLWDDDFTSWFSKIHGQSLWSLVGEWLSPISTQPQYWGFNERPLQKLVYKCLHAVFEYRAWGYFLFKDLLFAGMGAMIYLWALRLVPPSRAGRAAAAAAAVFFALAPGPAAALVIHADYAPLAELIFLSLTYLIWREIEATPAHWRGLPRISDPAQHRWLHRWGALALITYLGYKSKADLKLVPLIVAAYVLVVRRRQWAYFAFPLALMGLLAVPWGGGIFRELPPFLPGARGSQVDWMWQPASAERLKEFFWSTQGYGLWATLREPTLSLAAVLGPFLLLPLAAFLIWRMEAIDQVPWRRLDRSVDRARLFVLIWLGLVIVAISSLAAINYTFRIRYGILPMVPVALLLAWCLGLVAESWEKCAKPLPRWAAIGLVCGLVSQTVVNLERSLRYRHDMGSVMVAVDGVYREVEAHHATDRLALLPDFRPYDYKPDAPSVFRERTWLTDGAELVKKGFPENRTSVISWKPSLWDRLEITGYYPACDGIFGEGVFGCGRGNGAWLMRFIASDPDYSRGEELRAKGKLAEARKVHESFLQRHPASPAGYFVVGLESLQLGDHARAEEAYGWLEDRLPDHLAIVYNHALALEGLGRLKEAAARQQYIVDREPRNYAALIHLYWDLRKDGQADRARIVLMRMKEAFPQDPEVSRLMAEAL